MHETIAHLIFECIYAQQIWTLVTDVFDIGVNLERYNHGTKYDKWDEFYDINNCDIQRMVSIVIHR